MKLTQEQKDALPKKRANRDQYNAYLYLGAAYETLADAVEILGPRAQLIPYGLRDLKMIYRTLGDLCTNMLHTFDVEKQRQIKRTVKAMRIKTVIGPSVVKEGEQILIDTGDLAVIVNAAQQECKMRLCTPDQCRQCMLGQVLDRVSFVSRGNRAWWEVFEQALRRDVGMED